MAFRVAVCVGSWWVKARPLGRGTAGPGLPGRGWVTHQHFSSMFSQPVSARPSSQALPRPVPPTCPVRALLIHTVESGHREARKPGCGCWEVQAGVDTWQGKNLWGGRWYGHLHSLSQACGRSEMPQPAQIGCAGLWAGHLGTGMGPFGMDISEERS